MWGGYRISWVTLSLLFVVHFLLPFVVLLVMCIHLFLLHGRGRTRLVYLHRGVRKVTFYPYYWVKDGVSVVVYIFYVVIMLIYPYSLGEVELFEEINTLVSPTHIVPEWYFCAQYAMLRRVPSKGAGVLIMVIRVALLLAYPRTVGNTTPPSGISQPVVGAMVCVQVVLTYLGFAPIEQPFVFLRLIFTWLYFVLHALIMSVNLVADYYFGVDIEDEDLSDSEEPEVV